MVAQELDVLMTSSATPTRTTVRSAPRNFAMLAAARFASSDEETAIDRRLLELSKLDLAAGEILHRHRVMSPDLVEYSGCGQELSRQQQVDQKNIFQ